MQLGIKFFTVIKKTNAGKSFQLTPTSATISFPQPFEVTNFVAGSDCFNVFDFADDFKHAHVSMMRHSITGFKLKLFG